MASQFFITNALLATNHTTFSNLWELPVRLQLPSDARDSILWLWCSGHELSVPLHSISFLKVAWFSTKLQLRPHIALFSGLSRNLNRDLRPTLHTASVVGNYAVMSPRGSPLNTGDSLARPHPVIRTNRITVWKSVFAGMGLHVSRINDVYASRTRLGSVSRDWWRETTTARLEYTGQRTVWRFGIIAAFSMLWQYVALSPLCLAGKVSVIFYRTRGWFCVTAWYTFCSRV